MNSIIRRPFVILVLLMTGALSGTAVSAAGTSENYGGRAETSDFIAEMVSKHGFDQLTLEQLMADATYQQKIIDSISRPAEKVLTWGRYRKIFLTEQRIEAGKAFLQLHRQTFERAERELGVDRYIVTAILGVETLYGQRKGSWRVIDALATLAFDYPPRSKFFRKELEQYLLLSREQGFDPLQLKGSYAGAMGYGQFISSSYRHYAIDFDGDGVADLFNNPTDAIGSVANYFKRHKWRTGESVVFPAKVSGEGYQRYVSKKRQAQFSAAKARGAGVELDPAIADSDKINLVPLETETGIEYWSALHNFYVITRYNHSELYAMAVFQLAQAIAEE